ncbi:uncharacterized protein LOC132645574 [Lycium barbarum]|uniref:uncharacterized protein LOC132645574 n=1 Tax=Lycium barbarum TaxID=112863 RepID=UPI00293EE8D9|nr:uncharacterized protein LOC132645574 [Lycium barbarum]XP_060218605.1 uncharacterized protein LOC132645574 [Lycium barbarum]XP_060218606.1 uncharacterized protein LOC132645574 [Lycium barbarum]XP_060218607.1 uncharacterized protein LOC132645574 [Lycium barbarum]XP_060218608.1 uncharacterized protein LOC132645574 [Lycium barbarum]XP_060218609.1 uncharacterized protein LOC132645574 [Lycium barbarum]
MAKRSQRRPLRYEKDRTGCISGLISIFDFRHGRTTRKLLSDSRKRGSELDVGSACSSSMQELPNPSDNRLTIEDNEGSEVAVPDPRTSVKKLMEEEMVNEQSLKNQGNDSEIDAEEFDSQKSWRSRKNSRRTRRASNTHSHDFDSEAPCRQDFGGTALEDLDIVMEELRQIHQKNRKFVKLRQGLHNDHNKQSDQTHPVVEEKVNAAIEVFINQRSRNNKQLGEDNKTLQSKEFMDALQTLSSNKDFILRLLQDPNSRLVKQIGSLDEAQFEEKRKPNLISQSNMSEENRVHAKTDDVINHKQRKFFRRRSKSQEVYPPMGDETPRPSSKIVILKPGPAGLQSSSAQINVNTPVERTMQNERNTSQFSFTEIKRKLRHAMGKDRHGISPEGTIRRLPSEQLKRSNSERGISGENLGWSSPNRDHFYTEKFAKSPLGMKRGDKIVKSKGVEAVTPTEASDFPRPGMSNIYIEAKKHLVEMLDNENETTEVSSRQVPKSLGRILSFAEYNSSPGCSPREKSKDGMVPSQMREPLTGPKQDENDNRLQPVQEDHAMGPSPSSQDLEIESSCSDKYPNECTKSASTVLDVTCENGNTLNENAATTGDISPEGDLTEEAIKTRCQEECEILSAPIDREIQVDRDAINAVEDGSPSHGFELSFDCLKEHPSGKDEKTLSSPSASPADSSSPRKVEDPESVSVDRKERPSPVSVLEPLFAEDDVSPSSTICRPVDPEIQPRKIHFEEPVSSISEQDCPTVCFENEESAFEYVEAVLLGSGLSWDEFLLRWLSSDQILDPSLFDEVELFSSRSCHDQKLLFDSANEFLKAVCDRYFGCNTGVLLGKHNIRPVPKGMDLINEVWEGVEWYILQYSAPHSLDQLVKKDMERSGTWMNLRLDLGHIGVEMGEIILEELVDDTMLSISSDSFESAEHVLFPAKSEIEISGDQ